MRGSARSRNSPYPLGEFPNDVVVGVARQIVHRLAVGHADITGDDFGGIFADAINGTHYLKPFGVTDVVWNGCSWSAKTIKSANPHRQNKVRLISGRNSPDYSYGIADPRADIAATGAAVLNIWNARVNQSLAEHDELRVVVLMRNVDTLEFTLFEYEAGIFSANDYDWTENRRGNIEGRVAGTSEHRFTWQFHGSQFTVIKSVPGSARKFRLRQRPGVVEAEHILRLVGFTESWVEMVD